MILLDTNAVIWLQRRHPRSRPLTAARGRLYLSPATILELQLLAEVGRLTLASRASDIVNAGHWLLDDPPAADWFDEAIDLHWTCDPFDRLLVAHARLRGWRLATGDSALLERLGPRHTFAL